MVDTEISLEDVIQTVTVGQTTTGEPGTNAEVVNSGTGANPVLDFTIPRGQPGAPGPANTLSVGTVTDGEQATASITGEAPNQQLNLVLPKGEQGEQGEPGQNAVNPFKGWFNSLAELKAAHTAVEGDSAYVKDASPATTWSIYVYDSTASSDNYWADSGTDADTSHVQTFASSQEVNEVHIVNDLTTGGVDDVLSAEQGKVLGDKIKAITNETTLQNYYEGYAAKSVGSSSGMVYEINGWGLIFVNVKTGDEVIINFGTVGGAADANPCMLRLDENYQFINYYSYNGYTNTRTVTVAEGEKVFAVSFKLITDSGDNNTIPVEINGIGIEAHKYNEGKDEHWKEIELGGYLQSDTNTITGDIQDNPNYNLLRCCSTCKVVIPHESPKIRFIDKNNGYEFMYMFFMDSEGTPITSGRYSKFIRAGEILEVPKDVKCTRVVFLRRKNYIKQGVSSTYTYFYPIAPSELSGISIHYYDNESTSVIERNNHIEAKIRAGMRLLAMDDTGTYDKTLNGMNTMPCIAHISDVHGDSVRFKNFMDFCDHYKVDAAIGSGDMVLYTHENGTAYQNNICSKHTTPYLFCIGNHENWPYGQTSVFADNMSWLVTKYGYKKAANTNTDKCYYYKDFDGKKMRVITINYYEDCTYPGRIGLTQAEWLVSTLASTPAGYGVVIVLHSPEDKVVVDEQHNKFRQPSPNIGTSYQPNGVYVGGKPIMTIVDGFISKTSGTVTFYDHDAGSTVPTNTQFSDTPTTISYDFSNVDADTEFICYCCGHRHEDWIGYYNSSSNKQLVLDITCGVAIYGDDANYAWCNSSDLPRGGEGVTQDAFNVYTIDRYNGVVKITRIGSNVTQMMEMRDMMVIPYKD